MAEVNRRQFIATTATAAVGTAAAANAASPTGRKWGASSPLDAADFEPHVGEQFTVKNARSGELVKLELLEVTTNEAWERTHSGQPRPAELRRPFALLFKQKSGTALHSDNHAIAHPALGEAQLFLNPVAPGDGHMEICFS